MADPIPAADPALLAAQAKAGQAGVDAYKAAQASLVSQRQQAVQQAMQEAALRGAPPGAIPSIQSTITSPYDQGIASLTSADAAYQADMAARDRRMADYNLNVNAARSFIPLQTEQIVAPIRARGEFDVRQAQIAGERSVAEINANTQFATARMAAALQAAQIKAAQDAAKKKQDAMKLSQGELQGQLAASALQQLTGLGEKVQSDIKATQGLGTVAGVAGALKQAATPGTQAKRMNEFEAMGLRYMGQAAAAQNRPDLYGAGPTPRSAFAPVTGPLSATLRQAQAMGPGKAWGSPETLPPSMRTLNPTQMAAIQQSIGRGSRNITGRLGLERYAAAQGATKTYLGDVSTPLGYITAKQVQGYTPEELGYLTGAPRPFQSAADVQEMLLGAPVATTDEAGNVTYGTNPYAATASQLAAQIAGGRLQQQGYDITDQDILNAMGYDKMLKPGATAYDVQQQLAGQPTAAEQITAAEKADKAATAAAEQDTKDKIATMTAQEKQKELDAANYFFSQFQVKSPASVGTPRQVNSVIAAVPNFQTILDAAGTAVDKVRGSGGYTDNDIDDAIRKAMQDNNVSGNAGLFRILKAVL